MFLTSASVFSMQHLRAWGSRHTNWGEISLDTTLCHPPWSALKTYRLPRWDLHSWYHTGGHQQKLLLASWASCASDAPNAQDVNWRSGCRLTPRLRCDATLLPTKSSGSTRMYQDAPPILQEAIPLLPKNSPRVPPFPVLDLGHNEFLKRALK